MKREAPIQNVIDAAISGAAKDIYTCVPGYIVAFDPTTQRAQVQIGIQRVQNDGTTFDPPVIVDVPVTFPGDGYTVEYQINPGCEGSIHFSQRCIDGWKQTGGIAVNPVARFHHPQDAFFIPGIRSLGKAIPGFANNGLRLRNATGIQSVWLKNDGSCIMANANGSIQLLANGDVNINGTIIKAGTGNVTVATSLNVAGKEIANHVHRVNGTNQNSGPNL